MENELIEDGIETVKMERLDCMGSVEELESEHKIEMESLDGEPVEHGKESGQDKDLYSDLHSDETDAGIELGQKGDTQNGKSEEAAANSGENENGMGMVKETTFSIHTDNEHGDLSREGGQTTPTPTVRCACTKSSHCLQSSCNYIIHSQKMSLTYRPLGLAPSCAL